MMELDDKTTISDRVKTQADEYDEMVAYTALRKRRKKKVAIRIGVFALLILFVPVFIFLTIIVVSPTKGHNFFGYTFYIVQTQSMEPELMVGDAIIDKKIKSPDELKVGMDITFIRSSDGKVVTHRIAEIQETVDGYQYVTRGINNLTDDPITVNYNNILGKRIGHSAFIGQTVTFFRSSIGVVVMVSIFLVIVVGFVISFKLSEDIRAIGK